MVHLLLHLLQSLLPFVSFCLTVLLPSCSFVYCFVRMRACAAFCLLLSLLLLLLLLLLQVSRDSADPVGRCIVTCVLSVAPPVSQQQHQLQQVAAAAALSPAFEWAPKASAAAAAAARRFAASTVAAVVTAGLQQHQPHPRHHHHQQQQQQFLPLLLLAAMGASRQTAVASLLSLGFLSHIFLLNPILAFKTPTQQPSPQRKPSEQTR